MSVTVPSQGEPTKAATAAAIIAELDSQAGAVFAVAKLGIISNGSFEVGTTTPSGWTFTAQTGGTGVLDATTSAHGANSFKITSLGGGSNGGGELAMNEYCECSPQVPLLFGWQTKSDDAGVKNIVYVDWYSAASGGALLSTTTLWSEDTSNPTSWTRISKSAVPPATAVYFKLRFVGCDITDATAGNTWYDDVTVKRAAIMAVVSDSKAAGSAGGATVAGAWTDHALQTEVDEAGLLTLSGNQITLKPGRYNVTGWAMCYKTDGFKCRLRDTLNAATVFVGSAEYNSNSSATANTKSVFAGPLEITKPTTYKLQYYADTANGTDGLGKAMGGSSGEVAIFAQVTFDPIG